MVQQGCGVGEFEQSAGELRAGGGHRTVGDGAVLREDLTEGGVLGRGIAGLVQERVVVVRGDRGAVRSLVVRAVGEAEVRSPVEHVDVHGGARGEQPVEVARGVPGIAHRVGSAPAVEPADPELRAHQGPFGLVPAQLREPGLDLAAEVDGAQHSFRAAARQVRGLVAGEQGDVHAVPVQQPGQFGEVAGVLSVGPVLVLELDREHRAAPAAQPGQQGRQQRAEVLVHGPQEARVAAAQCDALLGEEPRGRPPPPIPRRCTGPGAAGRTGLRQRRGRGTGAGRGPRRAGTPRAAGRAGSTGRRSRP